MNAILIPLHTKNSHTQRIISKNTGHNFLVQLISITTCLFHWGSFHTSEFGTFAKGQGPYSQNFV